MKQSALVVLISISAAALGMCLFRTGVTGDLAYAYMVINLILAWIPLFLSLTLSALIKRKQAPTGIIIGFLWFLFYPNTLYIVTDFIHLQLRPPIPIWFDAIMLTLFALAGVLLGFASLYIVERALKKYLNGVAFSFTALLISSVGIYIGRFLRLNSWDLLVDPTGVTTHSIRHLEAPVVLVFVIGATLLSFAAYWLFRPALRELVDR